MTRQSTWAWPPIAGAVCAACLLIGSCAPPGYALGAQAQVSQKPESEAALKTVVDMTPEELLRRYRAELADVEFDAGKEVLKPLLQAVGEKVEAFFHSFSNTSSKEEVRMERFSSDGRSEDSTRQEFNYLILVHSEKAGIQFEEDRVDSRGRPIAPKRIKGFFISSGYAGLCMFFHPSHHFGSRFRYLGKQKSEPHAHVIAFAQKPEARDYLAGYVGLNSTESTPLLFQGIAWVDPDSQQILRMRTDLLEPEFQILLMAQTTEIQYSEVHFGTAPQSYWLPREVSVTWRLGGNTYRNRHRYSDYKVFSVESFDKIGQPIKKEVP
jgi:hypothetical protein